MPSRSATIRLSRFLAYGARAGLLILPLMAILPWYLSPAEDLLPWAGFPRSADWSWFTWQVRSLGAMISIISLGIGLWGLIGLNQAFTACARGETFSSPVIMGFRQFAVASVASAIWSPVEATVSRAALTAIDPGVLGQLSIGVGSEDFQRIGLAMMMWLIVHLLSEGRQVAQENEHFV